jgi:hypothetical protein
MSFFCAQTLHLRDSAPRAQINSANPELLCCVPGDGRLLAVREGEREGKEHL